MEIQRFVAFSEDPSGGNPAGVVLDARGLDESAMLAIAAEIGFSETAFVMLQPTGELDVRYFSPRVEVPFCGHATIATAVAWAIAHGPGALRLRTQAGPVAVATSIDARGIHTATLTSVPTRTEPMAVDTVTELLDALAWSVDDLDPLVPPWAAYAGAWHPIIAASTRARLAKLDYDLDTLGAVMVRHDWATINLVWRESDRVFHARNPFPPGGVYEDPATGAAAAALGGYLRERNLITPPATFVVHQGYDMGRPSTITVSVPVGANTGIDVTGSAVAM